MKRTIKKTLQLGVEDAEELKRLGSDFQSDINYFYSRFAGIRSINQLNFRDLRKRLKEEAPDNLRLTGHYQQRCLNAAVGNLKTMWVTTLKSVLSELDQSDLTDAEKEFVRVTFKSTAALDAVLNSNQPFEELIKLKLFDKWKSRKRQLSDVRENPVRQFIRRSIRKHKPKIPYTYKTNRFITDSTTYTFTQKGQLALQGPKSSTRKGRIKLDLDFEQRYRSEATAHLEGLSLTMHFPIDLKVKPLKGVADIGLDKGYRDLLIASSGRRYGIGYSDKVRPHVEARSKTHKGRQVHWVAYRKALADGDTSKAERILTNNLGRRKLERKARKFKELKKSLINQAINDMFKHETPKSITLEDLTWSKRSRRRKTLNHELSQWDKGHLQERLEFKAYERQVAIHMVNPAYTSQRCHRCGHFGDRQAQVFNCDHCGYSGHADVNASRNILQRRSDNDISTHTSVKRVKEILDRRMTS